MGFVVSAAASPQSIRNLIDGQTITPNIVCINQSLQVDVISPKTSSTICIDSILQVDVIEPKGTNVTLDGFLWPTGTGSNGQAIVTDGNKTLSFSNLFLGSEISVNTISPKTGSTICVTAEFLVDSISGKVSGATFGGVFIENENLLSTDGSFSGTLISESVCITDTLSVATIHEKTDNITIETTGSGSVFINQVEFISGGVGIFNEGVYSTIVTDASLNNKIMLEGRDYTFATLGSRQLIESRHRDFDLLSSETKITASDATASDAFGISCDVDGETVVVGAHKNGSGSAYVFNRHPNSTWSQKQILVGTSSSTFGHEVAISGNFIIVGAPGSTSDQGKAFIFEAQSDGTWFEAQTLTASDGATGDLFGSSVDISGFRAIVGAPGDDTSTGSAYIFERDSTGIWYQVQKVVASNAGTTDQFGFAVAISGIFAVVGSPREDTSGTDEGSVYIFERTSTGWPSTETQKIDASTLSGTITEVNFGSAVDIDNTYLIIGADAADTIVTNGKAVIFERNAGGVWIEAAEFTSPGVDELFGDSVAIKGNYAVVGAPGFSSGDPEGRIYIYERSITGTWSQIQAFQGTDTANNDNFGTAVGISGNYLVVGADADDDGGTDSGSAYIFEAGLAESSLKTDNIREKNTGQGVTIDGILFKDNTISYIGSTRLEELCSETGQGLNFISKAIYGSKTDNRTITTGLTSATGDLYYANLTINSGATLDTEGFRIFVNDTLTINGVLQNNGNTTLSPFGGSGAPFGSLGGGSGGGNGGTASSGGIGGFSLDTVSDRSFTLFSGGDGGDGDTGSGYFGGGGGTVGLLSDDEGGPDIVTVLNLTLRGTQGTKINGGGGGGGGGDGNAGGGNGGGGGGGGGVVLICANRIVMGANGEIQCKGGNGANAFAADAGGGGGGGGGLVVICTRTRPSLISGKIDVSGGTGGTTVGSGGATNGIDGQDGRIVIIEA